jgi:hypothetical protein
MTNFDEGKKSLHRMASTPGTFQFKIKSYDSEEGEYLAWQQAEPGVIIQFILTHWFNATLPNNLDIIIIKNEKGDQLVLDHENKTVFRFFLIPAEKGASYYYKMTDIQFMFFALEHFFSGLIDILKENLNKTTDDWSWVKGDFIQKNFHFTITRWRLFRQFWEMSILAFWWLIVFVALFFSLEGAAVGLGVAIVATALKSRNYRNRIRWYHDQRALQIQLSKGDRFIHVWLHNQKRSIAKADIISIQQHFTDQGDGEGDIWIPLYTQIDFQNGDTLNIHRMLMPQGEMKVKFQQETSIYHELNSNKRGIQKKTSLNGYFPEVSKKGYSK